MNIQSSISKVGGTNSSQPHDSGHKHVTGEAVYIDDIIEPVDTLHAYLGLSQMAHGEIVELNFEEVLSSPGVIGVLTEKDIPGHNDISPTGKGDEPVFAKGKVKIL